MAFVLAIQLHHRCKYLDLDKEKIMQYQFKCIKLFQDVHDQCLGKFNFGSLHPMTEPYITGIINNPVDKAPELPRMGWAVVNVLGDGNCGFYVLLAGLLNNGQEMYNSTSTTRKGQETPKGLEDWQKNVVRFRKDVHGQSEKLLERHFKMGEEPAWWTYIGSYSEKEREELSSSFFATDKDESVYYSKEAKDYQMFAYWGSLVFSSLFKMRVVLILRNSTVTDGKESPPDWSTTTFHVDRSMKHKDRITQVNGIDRMSDVHFQKTPTVEIFYTTGYKIGPKKKIVPVDNHFQFLRRVLVDDVTAEPTPEPAHPKLLDVLKDVVKTKGVDGASLDESATTDRRESEVEGITKPPEPVEESRRAKTVMPTQGEEESDSSATGVEVPIQQKRSTEESGIGLNRETGKSVEAVQEESHQPGNNEPELEEPPAEETQQLPMQQGIERNREPGKSVEAVEEESQQPGINEPVLGEPSVEETQQLTMEQTRPMEESGIEQSRESQKSVGEVEGAHRLEVNEPVVPAQREEEQNKSDNESESPSPMTQREEEHDTSGDESESPSAMTEQVDDSPAQASVTTRVSRRTPVTTTKSAQAKKRALSNPQARAQPAAKRPKTTRGREIQHSKPQARAQPAAKKPRTTRGKVIENYGFEYFDSHYWAGTLKHSTPARMKYDPVGDTFWVCFVYEKKFTQATEYANVDTFEDILVNQARRRPDEWVGCSSGDPGDIEVPKALRTSEKIVYQQHNQRFCLIYCPANALRYCELTVEAEILCQQARVFALKPFDEQLQTLKEFIGSLVPGIGRPTVFNYKNPNKKKYYKIRTISWESLFSEIFPHPTIVIPVGSSGIPSHAFCVVDDLIFDSNFPYALKLKRESVDLIFNDEKVDIFLALRFNMKWSPKGVQTTDKFTRKVKLNWNCPSRIFVERTCLDWTMPHYIMK